MGIGAALMVITEEAMETVGVTVWDGNNKRLTGIGLIVAED
jgi:hypothetical protein